LLFSRRRRIYWRARPFLPQHPRLRDRRQRQAMRKDDDLRCAVGRRDSSSH
jgi:hypothetical protein